MRRNLIHVKPGQRDRCRRILALVPKFNATSDVSDATSNEEEVNSRDSSPAPSINSSLERLDFNSPDQSSNYSYVENSDDDSLSILHSNLESIDSQSPKTVADACEGPPPLTPVLSTVFPSDTQCNYNAIPSITSLPSLPSVQPSPSTPPSTSTRVQRKRREPTVTASRVKRRNIQKVKLSFQWTKRRFQHAAEISDPGFKETVPSNWSAVDYFYRFFPEDLIVDIANNTNLYSVQETGRSIKATKEDILDFLAINILMGVVVMPSYKDYWKTSYRYGKIAEVMPIKRFQQIRRYL